MRDPDAVWDRLIAQARQAAAPMPALPAGFAEQVLARVPQRLDQVRSRAVVRFIYAAAVAASLLAGVAGFWSWDAVASEWNHSPLTLEYMLVLEPVP